MIQWQNPDFGMYTAHINGELVGYVFGGESGFFAYDKLGADTPAVNNEPLESVNHAKSLIEYLFREK